MTLYVIGFIALRVLCLAFFVVLAIRLALAWRGRWPDPALVALERRFAAGELAEADYRAMRKVLEE